MKNLFQNNPLLCSNILGSLFVSLVGTLFHFLYQWSNQLVLIGLFTPVNESTWEHMKLIFFPMLLYFLIEPIFFSSATQNWSVNHLSALIGTWLIPVLFYTYSGILGTNLAPLDIATFFISVFFAFFVRYRLYTHPQSFWAKWAVSNSFLIVLLTAILFLAFLWFSFHAPNFGIFLSPV